MTWEIGVAAGLSALDFVMTASSGAKAASAQEQQALIEKQQYEDQATMAVIQAQEEESTRRRQLGMTLATQKAQGASSGYSLDQSPSFGAIQSADRRVAARDILNIQLLGAARKDAAMKAAWAAGQRADYFSGVRSTSWITGLMSAAKTGFSIYTGLKSFAPATGPTPSGLTPFGGRGIGATKL